MSTKKKPVKKPRSEQKHKKVSQVPLGVAVGVLGFCMLLFGGTTYGLFLRTSPAVSDQPILGQLKSPNDSYKIAAVGDISCSEEQIHEAKDSPPAKAAQLCQMDKVVKSIKEDNPQSVLVLGDLQYETGSADSYQQQFAPLWAPLKARSYSAIGNHEYATKDAKGYFDYWNSAPASSKQAGERGKGYYSVNLGKWHLIALNSNCEEVGGCTKDSLQGQWLAKDLSDNKGTRCTLAFWHHPRFSSGRYGDLADTSGFWDSLYQNHADVVLNGHDHIYERFARQRPDGTADAVHGIRQFTDGTGGKNLYNFKDKFVANHEFSDNNHFGFLHLNLYSTGYSWQYKTIDGRILDQGSSTCNV